MTAASGDTATRVGGWRDTFAGWTGKFVVVAAAWCLLALAFPRSGPIDVVSDVLGWSGLPVGPSLFSFVLLALLGGAVRRRLRFGFLVLLVFEALAAGSSLLLIVGSALGLSEQRVTPGQYVDLAVSAVVPVLALVGLLLARRAFRARLESGARWRALLVLVSGIAASMVLAVALTEVFPNRLDGGWRRVVWGIRVAVGLEPSSGEANWRGQVGHHWVAIVAGVVSAAALVAAAYVFLRSTRSKHWLTAQDELDLRALLLRHGEDDSLGYFATRHDKSVVFAPGHDAAVTYRVLNSVSLASADPIGAPGAWAPAIETWLAEARRYGWFPAVLSASTRGAEAYVAAGLKAIPLGDEAIIDVDGFTLEGPTMQPVRRAVQRVARAGYTITISRHAELTAEQLAEIDRRAEDWRGDDTERGFSMALGRIGDPVDGSCVAVLAHDAEGRLRGLLSFVPWGRRGLSLDLMRRDRDCENGLVEAMVSELALRAGDLGVRRISLNFAMFRGVFSAAERVGAGPMVRATNAVLTFASRFWQLESLYRSNARYLPRWEPRFLCYDSSLTLTRVSVAAGKAEGFLPAAGIPPTRAVDGAVRYDGQDEVPFAVAALAQEKALRDTAVRPVRRPTQQQQARLDKIALLEKAGEQAYPVGVPRTASLADVVAAHGALQPGGSSGAVVSVAGRVRVVRDLGGLVFAVLTEGEQRLQVMVSKADVGDDGSWLFRHAVDLGDQISVTGEVVRSRTGELSVLAHSWCMASKCLRPLPGLRAGFTDSDARVRQRYLDLIVNDDARAMLQRRSVGVLALRTAFVNRGYLEVETPMLQAVHGGANARPFTTHINAYDTDLYLRIAPELFLKRLCVGGVEKVFECNRNFRNEGADATHNPEFTSLEAYEAFGDYDTMRRLTREVVLEMATAVWGRPVALRDGEFVDLSGEWPVVTVHEAVSRATGTTLTADTGEDELRAVCARHGVAAPSEANAGELVNELYDALVEKQTTFPTFYKDFPIEGSPLTRRHRCDPRLSERWDLVAFGAELGTAYSELIDPVDQRERLVTQSAKAAAGDPEAMEVDEAFLTALEYAMPPTGGLGLGVDRLVMMLTGASIRQTLAFPYVR
ncbi:bifunctional lysylphosphatidylglycerol synthetase/lysine--tRNA ligase LysX [Jatrophihabitans sp. YIM 134969]